MSSKVKINLYIGTGFAGCKYEDHEYVDRDEWEAMSEEEQQDYLDQAAQDFLANHIEWSAYVDE